MSSATTLPQRLPAPGELVQVRSRRWLVEGVSEPEGTKSAVVRLACADDDAQGQPLEVLWENELDRRILEAEAWHDLAATRIRPAEATSPRICTPSDGTASPRPTRTCSKSPFRAGIKIDAYQIEPLRKALRLPRVNLFIADDIGLGKTIEAGLIARELLLRKKVQDIVVAAPPSVLEQWQDELEDRFGLVFEILDRNTSPGAAGAGVRHQPVGHPHPVPGLPRLLDRRPMPTRCATGLGDSARAPS